MRETKIGGRVYLQVDPVDVEPDDVVEYMSADPSYVDKDQNKPIERRCHRVDGVRRGKEAAVRVVRVVPHEHEVMARRWHPIECVIRAWRRRTEFKRRPRRARA